MDNGEGMGILVDDLADQRHLGLVDHAQKHAGFPAGVHALCGEEGRGVVELPDQRNSNSCLGIAEKKELI